MIDWYIILFLAAGVIIFNLNRVAEHRSPLEFLMIGKKYGIKQGTILLWISFFGGYSLLIPIYFVYHFGLLISIGYFLCFFIFAYFLMSYFVDEIQRKSIREPLTRFYKLKFTAVGYRLFLPLLVVANMEGLLLQLTLANKVFSLWFPQRSLLFVALLLLFCLIFAGLGGMFTIYRTVYFHLLICGFALLFVPLFLFLKDGIHPVFESYLSYEKHRNLQWSEMMMIFIAIPIAFIGWLLTNSFLWQVLQSTKENYRHPSLKLSIFCFASIPASILIYGIYAVSKQHPNTFFLFIENLLHIPSRLILMMIILIWLAGVVHSIAISLYSMAALFLHSIPNKWQPSKKIRVMYIMIIFLSLFVFIGQYWLVNYLGPLFISYILFYLTLSFPLWGLSRGSERYSCWLAVCLIVLWIAGIVIFFKSNSPFFAVEVSIISSIVCMLGMYLSRVLKIGNIL